MNKSQLLIGAAVAGILGASSLASAPALAADQAGSEKGQCVGANGCKGKTACAAKDGANSCKGQNACKGKGWIESTKAKCDKMAKKNKAIHFEPSGQAAAPAAKNS